MMPLVLHKLDSSPPARAVMMVGHVLEIPFDFIEPNFMAGEHLEPDYVEKNPMHTIPLLEDKDFVLADSHAIATYLINKYGADKRAALYPSDLYDRAVIDARLHFDTGVLFTRLKAIVDPTIKGTLTGLNDELIARVEDAYQILEAYLNKSKYVALDHFTVADICCGATVTSLNTLVPIDCERFPRVIEWFGALHAESCFQEINSNGVQEFNSFVNNMWMNNQSAGAGVIIAN